MHVVSFWVIDIQVPFLLLVDVMFPFQCSTCSPSTVCKRSRSWYPLAKRVLENLDSKLQFAVKIVPVHRIPYSTHVYMCGVRTVAK